MKLAFVVDHFHRDLNGYLALINKILEEKNIDIYLINLYHIYEVYLIDADVIVLQNLRPENIFIAKDLKRLNKKIVVIDNEGVPFGWTSGNDHIEQFSENLSKNLKHVDAYIVWGEYIRKLLDTKKIDINKVYVLGNQRFELFKNKYSYLYSKRKTSQKAIVVNTNFPNSNPNYTLKKLDKADLEKKMYYDSKDKNKLVKEYLSNSDVIFNNYTVFLKKLINDFQDLKIILNVHPFEGKEHYKKIFSEEKNVLILKNNFLLPQLYLNYDFIINYNSTTCAETLLSNKKSLSVNFVDPNNIQNKYYNNFSIPFQNYDDLKKFINNYEISKKKLSDIDVETKNSLNFLYNNANNDALNLISNALNNINVIKDEKKVKLTTKYFLFFKYFIFFSYDKINLFKVPLRIFKLIIIFILNSNNFYLLKEKIFENYKKKHFSIKKIDLFFKKLNKNKLEKKKINYSKPSILRFLFRHLIVIKINKYL
jgi:surface carbohydrate biosynthesis protein